MNYNTTAPGKYAYSIDQIDRGVRDYSGNYGAVGTIQITVYAISTDPYTKDRRQIDPDTALRVHAYGTETWNNIRLSTNYGDCDSLEEFLVVTGIVRAIWRNAFDKNEYGTEGKSVNQGRFKEALKKMKATQVVLDNRVDAFVPVDEVLGSEYQRWVDDYHVLGESSCNFSVIATSEEQAKKLIIAKAVNDTSYLRNTSEWLGRFVAAGQPVRVAAHDKAPVVLHWPEALEEESTDTASTAVYSMASA